MADYLFTWKHGQWPYDKLRVFLDRFDSNQVAEEPWRCAAHRRIRPGDRAYMLKQGKPIGIFGRGTVIDAAKKSRKKRRGENPWSVQIRFDASQGDVLWDPLERLLVDEAQLHKLSAPEQRWRTQASGIGLEHTAAEEIDTLIFDSIRVGRIKTVPADEIVQEVLRKQKLVEQSIRPDQQEFRKTILNNYSNSCAVTGCCTPAALDAAHISTKFGRDDNSPTNGILLRSDIHALFDKLLITLSEDGARLEISTELSDPSYHDLRSVAVTRPTNYSPSKENISGHRKLFSQKHKIRVGSDPLKTQK